MKVCLDTNVFITIKNKEEDFESCIKILNAIEEKRIEGSVSTIVLAEVLVGFYIKNEKNEANRFLSSAILNFDVVPVNLDITQMAAQIRVQYGIKLPDAIITASSINSNSDYFITYNKT
ncbi:MAG: PIN domain-containing protein, partial [Candidatus Lokiarchaeota archaeon]|nr:PIN domain-containing protein [Candidatus Lokiarchaeota archaeon]